MVYSRRRLRCTPPPTLYTDAQLRQKKITPVATADVSISGERTREKCQRWRCSRLAMTTRLQMTMSCERGSGVDESRQSTLRGLYNIHAAYTQSATATTILKDLVHRVTEKNLLSHAYPVIGCGCDAYSTVVFFLRSAPETHKETRDNKTVMQDRCGGAAIYVYTRYTCIHMNIHNII